MISTRRFPWFLASFFLLLSIGGLIAYDVSRVNGDFPKSATGKLLNDLGILEQSQWAWQRSLSTSARGYIWMEANAPVYYSQTVEACKPYGQLTLDFLQLMAVRGTKIFNNMRSYVETKSPTVTATIEEYAPGLVENVQSYAASGYAAVKKYSEQCYLLTAEYLKTKVFVGDWAPEILQNKTQVAFNATRFHVSSYYHWFREQIHIYSEIP